MFFCAGFKGKTHTRTESGHMLLLSLLPLLFSPSLTTASAGVETGRASSCCCTCRSRSCCVSANDTFRHNRLWSRPPRRGLSAHTTTTATTSSSPWSFACQRIRQANREIKPFFFSFLFFFILLLSFFF